MSKSASLLCVIALSVLSIIAFMPKPGLASINKPSIPEFTIELLDSSYNVPPSYSTDPYTGKNVVHDGYHVESRTIEFKITNQPFTPYQMQENENNWTINFYYNIRLKGHYTEEWTEMFLVSDGYPRQDYESDYTVFSYQGEYSSTDGLEFNHGSIRTSFPSGAQVDFQVEAMIGYVHRDPSTLGWIFTGEESGWSNTQTITIDEYQTSSSSPATSPLSPQSTLTPEQATIIIGAVIVAVVVAAGLGLLIYIIKRK
jgi:hypothetical protein